MRKRRARAWYVLAHRTTLPAAISAAGRVVRWASGSLEIRTMSCLRSLYPMLLCVERAQLPLLSLIV